MKKLGLYIHIPFCERKCSYCGFLSFPLMGENIKEYVNNLCLEIKNEGKRYKEKYIVDTVFIGGGTPSLLTTDMIKQIMNTLKESFNIDENAEISIESNPNSLSFEKLKCYKEYGINRLSMGVQSFDDKILKKLGRVHDKSTAINAFKLARKSGFDNINIDIMFAVEDQNEKIWAETLGEVLLLEPEHISFYSLQIEEGTEYYDRYKNENLNVPSDEVMNRMYEYAVNTIKNAKYDHYEISNCSKIGYNCRHNLKYWNMDDYLALGLGASGYIDGCRYKNPDDLKIYEAMVKENWEIYRKPEFEKESLEDSMSIYCFTSLRTNKGIDFKYFKERYGKDFMEVYKNKRVFIYREIENGNFIMTKDHLKLSEKGILVSNDLMCEFV